MLYFLTGDIQTGKTRWLQALVAKLELRGALPCGVVAPGIWEEREGPDGSAATYEKLGIDNLLLPDKRTVPFARRRDLAQAAGSYDAHSQSARADLRWAIDDRAIDEVNAHFATLARITQPANRLLVVDELGRLELLRSQGLTNAVALLDRGATPAFPHALVVVRAQLLERAWSRFSSIPWGGMRDIAPDDAAMRQVLAQISRRTPSRTR